jgi:translation initiation factor IF-3
MAIKGGQRGGRKEPAHRLNELITGIPGDEIRLIKFDGEAGGIVSLDEAMDQAEEAVLILLKLAQQLILLFVALWITANFFMRNLKNRKNNVKSRNKFRLRKLNSDLVQMKAIIR